MQYIINKNQPNPHNITITHKEKLNLCQTIYSDNSPAQRNLVSKRLNDLLLELGYDPNNTTLSYNDTHIQQAKNIIDDPDITPEQREILLRLIKRP